MRKVSLLIPLLTLLPPGDCDCGQEVARLGTAAKPRPVGTAAKPRRPAGGRKAREFKYTFILQYQEQWAQLHGRPTLSQWIEKYLERPDFSL